MSGAFNVDDFKNIARQTTRRTTYSRGDSEVDPETPAKSEAMSDIEPDTPVSVGEPKNVSFMGSYGSIFAPSLRSSYLAANEEGKPPGHDLGAAEKTV